MTTIVNTEEILNLIPHRYPFLLVDRVLDYMPFEHLTAIKNVTMNEPHFQGHFPGHPVMPGVLIVEAMAQTSAIVCVESLGVAAEGKVVYFMTIDNARFRKPVTPGDSLIIEVTKIRSRANVWKFQGVAKVGDQVCAEATFSAMITDK